MLKFPVIFVVLFSINIFAEDGPIPVSLPAEWYSSPPCDPYVRYDRAVDNDIFRKVAHEIFTQSGAQIQEGLYQEIRNFAKAKYRNSEKSFIEAFVMNPTGYVNFAPGIKPNLPWFRSRSGGGSEEITPAPTSIDFRSGTPDRTNALKAACTLGYAYYYANERIKMERYYPQEVYPQLLPQDVMFTLRAYYFLEETEVWREDMNHGYSPKNRSGPLWKSYHKYESLMLAPLIAKLEKLELDKASQEAVDLSTKWVSGSQKRGQEIVDLAKKWINNFQTIEFYKLPRDKWPQPDEGLKYTLLRMLKTEKEFRNVFTLLSDPIFASNYKLHYGIWSPMYDFVDRVWSIHNGWRKYNWVLQDDFQPTISEHEPKISVSPEFKKQISSIFPNLAAQDKNLKVWWRKDEGGFHRLGPYSIKELNKEFNHRTYLTVKQQQSPFFMTMYEGGRFALPDEAYHDFSYAYELAQYLLKTPKN